MPEKKLNPRQVEKLVQLRELDEPVTIKNLARRFSVSERTIYYYLAQYRDAQIGLSASIQWAQARSN